MVEENGSRAGGGELAARVAVGERAPEVPVVSGGQGDLLPYIATATDEEVLAQIDALLVEALAGDGRAIGAIAIGLGPTLLREVHQELGEGCAQGAWDVLPRFFRAMSEGTMRFQGERGTGLAWMKRIVRAGAREHL